MFSVYTKDQLFSSILLYFLLLYFIAVLYYLFLHFAFYKVKKTQLFPLNMHATLSLTVCVLLRSFVKLRELYFNRSRRLNDKEAYLMQIIFN